MKIYIVGIGTDGEKTLTAEAKSTVEGADVLIGAKRMTEPFEKLGKPVFVSWKADEIGGFLKEHDFHTAAVLMSGDCGFFSGAEKLKEQLSEFDTVIISGISTPVYLCARLGISWQDMRFISLHATRGNIVRNVRRYGRCFFLLGGNVSPSEICKRLCEYGMADITVHIGARLSYPDERIISGTARELTEVRCDPLCAVIAENTVPEESVRAGIPDGEFIRGKVPMTKAEVRAVLASKLEICYNDIVWDIGSGTGSVSVECALAANDGTVLAVDRSEEAVSLTRQNALKFGCDNIQAIHGEAPEILDGLPAPDKVFIGGAGGQISAILEAAFREKASPRVVITAVSLETLGEAVTALNAHGITPDITQLSAVRYKTLGKHTMPDAQSPVFIIEGNKE